MNTPNRRRDFVPLSRFVVYYSAALPAVSTGEVYSAVRHRIAQVITAPVVVRSRTTPSHANRYKREAVSERREHEGQTVRLAQEKTIERREHDAKHWDLHKGRQ
jgi:hypothetical protein